MLNLTQWLIKYKGYTMEQVEEDYNQLREDYTQEHNQYLLGL